MPKIMIAVLTWGWQLDASLVQISSLHCLDVAKGAAADASRGLATPGEQPPELALGGLGGVLAAWSGQRAGTQLRRVDEVAGHHAAEAAAHHLQRSCPRISPFGSRSKCTLRHSHQGRNTPWNSESTMLTLCLLVPARRLTIAAMLPEKLVRHQHG